MATDGGQSSAALNRVIARQFGRFNVFQLVSLLQRRAGGEERAATWPLGARVRFQADLRASFPAHEITGLGRARAMPDFRDEVRREQKMPTRLELRTPNYCLASELGPLPEPFLEWVRDQERLGGHAMAAFLDVFNQRVHVLRHELKQRSLRALDPALPEDTRYAGHLAALMGMALPALQRQMPLPKRAWLGIAGLLINHRRSAAVVEQVLTAYLGVTSSLQVLVGRWRDIEPGDCIALGHAQHALGRLSLLGRRTWDARAGVRLHVARLRYDAVCDLLPLRPAHHGEALPSLAHRGLVAMVRLLLDRRFDCDVLIEIDPDSVPPPRLQFPWRAGGLGLRLGQTAWLGRHRGQPVCFRIAAFDGKAAA